MSQHPSPAQAAAGALARFTRSLDFPLPVRSRVLVVAASILLLPVYVTPLWRMSFYSNQFPDGLRLRIYCHRLEGARTASRDDLREINNLNHYIGMRPLLESEFSEFRWLPLLVGFFVLFAWRVAVIGKISALLDTTVAFIYFGLFSLWSFYRRLYEYGHNLDPQAAFKVEPFTPPLLGVKQIANFTVYSYPDVAAILLVAFALLLIYSLYHALRQAWSSC